MAEQSAKENTESMADEGKRLFVQNHCAGCHGPDSAVQAPRLEGVYGKPVPVAGRDDERPVRRRRRSLHS